MQFGGGLRSPQAVSDALDAGAERVILGTAAFINPDFLRGALERWPGRVLVSVDLRGGKVATAGWTETIDLTAEAVVAKLWEQGASELVYTNVDGDGLLGGLDLDEVRDIANVVKPDLFGWHRRCERPGGPRRLENATPQRRDCRQGLVRAALHGDGGASRSRPLTELIPNIGILATLGRSRSGSRCGGRKGGSTEMVAVPGDLSPVYERSTWPANLTTRSPTSWCSGSGSVSTSDSSSAGELSIAISTVSLMGG